MTTPTGHYLALTTRYDKQVRAHVVNLQPLEKPWKEETVMVYIVSHEWLERGCYPAAYFIGGHQVSGRCTVFYTSASDEPGVYVFKGIFEGENKISAL